MKFVRHLVANMDESMIQECLICGEVLADYTNAMWQGDIPPQGFPQGEVFVSVSKNPQHFEREISDTDISTNCK